MCPFGPQILFPVVELENFTLNFRQERFKAFSAGYLKHTMKQKAAISALNHFRRTNTKELVYFINVQTQLVYTSRQTLLQHLTLQTPEQRIL